VRVAPFVRGGPDSTIAAHGAVWIASILPIILKGADSAAEVWTGRLGDFTGRRRRSPGARCITVHTHSYPETCPVTCANSQAPCKV
jgi:hypothetical protein